LPDLAKTLAAHAFSPSGILTREEESKKTHVVHDGLAI